MRHYASELREGMIVETLPDIWNEIEWIATSPTQVIVKFNKFQNPSTYPVDKVFLVKPNSCMAVL